MSRLINWKLTYRGGGLQNYLLRSAWCQWPRGTSTLPHIGVFGFGCCSIHATFLRAFLRAFRQTQGCRLQTNTIQSIGAKSRDVSGDSFALAFGHTSALQTNRMCLPRCQPGPAPVLGFDGFMYTGRWITLGFPFLQNACRFSKMTSPRHRSDLLRLPHWPPPAAGRQGTTRNGKGRRTDLSTSLAPNCTLN